MPAVSHAPSSGPERMPESIDARDRGSVASVQRRDGHREAVVVDLEVVDEATERDTVACRDGLPQALVGILANDIELQVRMAELGVQLHGGHGYMDEYPISRQYTDARISTIYAGSSEVMKIIISRDCLSDDYAPFNTRNF
mgnify:CR=1 FL=1